MSLLVIGVSHRSAPMGVLEQVALDTGGAQALARAAGDSEHVTETMVLATCNRVEVYADVVAFHSGVADITQALAGLTGLTLDRLKDHLYVHYADRAVAHLFTVACGLDSMAVGEGQVLGQLRWAWAAAQSAGTSGRVLGSLMQQSLRVGKRAHAETGIDRAGASLLDAALDRARVLHGSVSDLSVLIVGAGSMSGLAAGAVQSAGVRSVTVVNRTTERARLLADRVGGSWRSFDELGAALTGADVVISCTGAVGHVIDAPLAAAAAASRRRPQLYVDLALPRDVAPEVGRVAGVQVVDLEDLGRDLVTADFGADVEQVREIVAHEVGAYLAGRRVQAVAPTVVALRAKAATVVDDELDRLGPRLPDLDPRVRDEVEAQVRQTVNRVVDKLLHTPTVRVKELAGGSGGGSYAAALRVLFDLDPEEVSTVSDVPTQPADEPSDRQQALIPPIGSRSGRTTAPSDHPAPTGATS